MTLDSPAFLAISFISIVLIRLSENKFYKDITITTANLIFLYLLVVSWQAAAVLTAMLVTVYVLGEFLANSRGNNAKFFSVAGIVGLWIFLFLLKDPDLWIYINPFSGHSVAIVGISYMAFRCICYLMEINTLAPQGPLRFFAYVTFFPTIFAGPIDRWRNFNTTLAAPENISVMISLHRVADGFIKKFVIADNLFPITIPAVAELNRHGDASVPLLWLAGISELFLIYLDFSGYCDIVIGISQLMGIRVIENFNHPFRSRNIQEFWERWHISLSSLLRDFVFNPITKLIYTNCEKDAQFPLVIATYFFVMVLIALWHKTTVGFLMFGLTHGSALVLFQLWQRYSSRKPNRPIAYAPLRLFGIVVTYLFVSLSMVLWMSGESQWFKYYVGMIGIK